MDYVHRGVPGSALVKVWLYTALEACYFSFDTLDKDSEPSFDVLRYVGYLVFVIGTLNGDPEPSFRVFSWFLTKVIMFWTKIWMDIQNLDVSIFCHRLLCFG